MQVGLLLGMLVQTPYDGAALAGLHDRLSLEKERRKAEEEKRPIPEELPPRAGLLTATERLQKLLKKTPPWDLHTLQERQDPTWQEPFEKALTDPFCREWFRRYYPRGVDKAPAFRGTWQEVIDRCQKSTFESFFDTPLMERPAPFRHYVATRRFCVVGEGQYLWIASRKKLWERQLHLTYLSNITAIAAFAHAVYTGHAQGEVCRWDLDQGTYVFYRPKGEFKLPVSYLAATRSRLYVGLASTTAVVYENDDEIQSKQFASGSSIVGIFTHRQKVQKPPAHDPEGALRWIEEDYFVVCHHNGHISCWKSSSLIDQASWQLDLEGVTSLAAGGIFLENRLLVGGNLADGGFSLYRIDLEGGTSTVYQTYDDSQVIRLEKAYHLSYCVTTTGTFAIDDDQHLISMGNAPEDLLEEETEARNASFKFVNHFQGLYVKSTLVGGATKYQLILRDFASSTSVAQRPLVPAVATSRKVIALALACFAGLIIATACLIPLGRWLWRRG